MCHYQADGLFLIFTVLAVVCENASAERGLSPRVSLKYNANRSILRMCKLFKDKDLRRTCRLISLNPVFSEDSLNHHDIESSARMATTRTKLFATESQNNGNFESAMRELAETAEEDTSFPALNPSYECINGFSGSWKHQRSISPWKYYLDVNPRRIPEKIVFAKCLCTGCIDVSTELEDFNLSSERLTTRETVIMKKSAETRLSECDPKTCEITQIEVPIGCHCTKVFYSKK